MVDLLHPNPDLVLPYEGSEDWLKGPTPPGGCLRTVASKK